MSLVVFGVLTRTAIHWAPNVEFVTAITFLACYIYRDLKVQLGVPILIMFLSDLIIGNTSIFIFTWTGFLLPVVLMHFFGLIYPRSDLKVWQITLLALISTLLFFLWTNFGVVVVSEMYSKDAIGLLQSYVNGLPFLRNQLFGNLMIVPGMLFVAGLFSDLEDRRVDPRGTHQAKVI